MTTVVPVCTNEPKFFPTTLFDVNNKKCEKSDVCVEEVCMYMHVCSMCVCEPSHTHAHGIHPKNPVPFTHEPLNEFLHIRLHCNGNMIALTEHILVQGTE